MKRTAQDGQLDQYTLALCGDLILNTRVSACRNPGVQRAIDLIAQASVAYGHLEIPLHDFDSPDIFPSAEGALSWMCGPTWVAHEIRRCGFDLVSLASNHALDYSYGGLRSTMAALRDAGIAYAGAGADLGAARFPAFVDTAPGRVALVSAASSVSASARAGPARADMVGRPGISTLRYRYVVDTDTGVDLRRLFRRIGYWVTVQGREFAVHPPGLHNNVLIFRMSSDVDGISTECDPEDLDALCASMRYARSVADVLIAHLHCHEWDLATGDMASSPTFARQYAEAAVKAGATVVFVHGSHAPMRGLEVIGGIPVFYDPGPLFRLGRRDRQPQEFYDRWGNPPGTRKATATLVQAYASREGALGDDARKVESPLAGVSHDPGFVIPVCHVDALQHRIRSIDLHPADWESAPRSATGFPRVATGAKAKTILDHFAGLCAPYQTEVTFEGDIGVIRVDPATTP